MVLPGLQQLVTESAKLIRDRRVGVLCHHASFTGDLKFAVDALRAGGANVVRLLGPEHGPWGTAQDMIPVAGGRDSWTGLELVSLYGDTEQSLVPNADALAGLDVLVVDLQDVGARYYTYVQTAAYAVTAAAAAGVECVVCDRPNPIDGVTVEGVPLLPSCRSFVGMHPVPQRHGLTLGELVQCYTNGQAHIIPMTGWQRTMWFDETGLPWIPPSPNMPTLTAAALYPGLCLLEGTNLSEGRGTTTPFEVFGAPFIDPFKLANALNDMNLPGVISRPHVFSPMFQKHQEQACGGVQLVVTDRKALQPLRLGIAILCTVKSLCPNDFQWRTESYEFVSDHPAIDLLLGDHTTRECIDAGGDLTDITAQWPIAEAGWLDTRREWVMYD
jgi:uncharacterized protein YbbC (DUF1343 family)